MYWRGPWWTWPRGVPPHIDFFRQQPSGAFPGGRTTAEQQTSDSGGNCMNLARFARAAMCKRPRRWNSCPPSAGPWATRPTSGSSGTTCCPARAAATRPASWISPLPTPWPRRGHHHHLRGRAVQPLPPDSFLGGQGRPGLPSGAGGARARQLQARSLGQQFSLPTDGREFHQRGARWQQHGR